MRTRWKARLVHAALVLLTLWPLVHLWLGARFELSPWKLAGWGMYAEPRFGMLGMEVYGRVRGSSAEEPLAAPPRELQAVATEYLERYRWLRKLARPEALARAALALHPEWDQVRVVVFRPELDRASGMVVMTRAESVVPAASIP
jgi:hypothetical protein